MACDYGWDWGPETTTVGIWRPLFLESWRGARIAAVRPLVSVEGDTGVVRVDVDVVGEAGGPLRVSVGGVHVESKASVVEVRVPDVELWWPRGYGGQPLYDLVVRLGDEEWQGRIGFRTVAVDARPDELGTPFTLVVNGERVFARGFNWIPGDCFPSRVDRAPLS